MAKHSHYKGMHDSQLASITTFSLSACLLKDIRILACILYSVQCQIRQLNLYLLGSSIRDYLPKDLMTGKGIFSYVNKVSPVWIIPCLSSSQYPNTVINVAPPPSLLNYQLYSILNTPEPEREKTFFTRKIIFSHR